MLGTQHKHSAPHRRVLWIRIAHGLLLIRQRLLVRLLLSFRPHQVFEPRLLLFLRQLRNPLARHRLGNHVHANRVGETCLHDSQRSEQNQKQDHEQGRQGNSVGPHASLVLEHIRACQRLV